MSKDLNLAILVDLYRPLLTEKQQETLEMYYDSDLSLGEISEETGITRQGVRDSIKRAECILLDLEAKIGWAGRYRELGAALQKIEAQTRLIQSYHEQGKILGTGVYDATVEILSTLRSIEQ